MAACAEGGRPAAEAGALPAPAPLHPAPGGPGAPHPPRGASGPWDHVTLHTGQLVQKAGTSSEEALTEGRARPGPRGSWGARPGGVTMPRLPPVDQTQRVTGHGHSQGHGDHGPFTPEGVRMGVPLCVPLCVPVYMCVCVCVCL